MDEEIPIKKEIESAEEKLIQWRKVTQSWIHSRKALLLLVTFAIATVALFTKFLTGDQWITIIKWAVPSYLGSNVVDGAVSGYLQQKDTTS